jgi:molybdate-binding protein
LGDEWKKPNRILISGCDPNVSILAHSLQQQGYEMVVVYENSSRSIESLRCKIVHIAGTHMVDMAGGKADWMPLKKIFGRNSIAVVSYAVWQEGLLTANGNPKGISAITDLVRNDVCIANREPGAGCRRLLDDLLHRFDIAGSQVRGYDHVSVGHLPAARLVRSGEADCCISTQAVARALSLNFIPLVEKPYSLVLHREHLSLPSIQTLIEVLGRASFRREVEACTGYNMRTAGDRLI